MNKSRLVVFVFCIVVCVTHLLGQNVGNASFYANRFHGAAMASGQKYHKDSMFCAHKTYPFGTILKVTNLRNDKSVYVRVTDRGPHHRNRIIDLSYAAAKALDIVRFGYAAVEINVVEPLVIPYRAIELPKPSFDMELADEEEVFIPLSAKNFSKNR